MESGLQSPAPRGQNREDVRQHNLSTVLRLVRLSGTISRSQLTAATGLNRSTISDLVAELEERGLAVETEALVSSGVGRPSLMVSASDNVVAFAVHPEVDATTVGAVTLSGRVIAKERVLMPHSPKPRDSELTAAKLISKISAELDSKYRVAGVGVAVPGQVRVSDGVIRYAPQLAWVEAAFGPELSQLTRLPVYLDNDASIGCMAERNFGSAKGFSDVVFLFAGSGGIGGGAIVDGKQLRGTSGYGGELGHVRISSSTQRDFSGFEGTLEALVRRDDLLELFKLFGATDEELDREIQTVKTAAARDVIYKQIDHLADGLSNFVTIFNPQAVVLGGFLTSLFNFDSGRLIERMKANAVGASAERVVVRPAGLGSNLLMVGAAELPFEMLMRNPSGYLLEKSSQATVS
jgi:predicted NBD/HSP70 family sugar kinase|uniref:ROK family protein n=1 Tax=uncultured Micrococcales bacterium TaxID=1920814 RepID=A0A871XYH6_9MICO|nr:ROK family protein [uncultured Micrococcales bacterium]QOV09029.1 ROK family protein [uncultured Micrococcales bacterium]